MTRRRTTVLAGAAAAVLSLFGATTATQAQQAPSGTLRIVLAARCPASTR